MSLNKTVLFDFLRVGLGAAAFILLVKWLFVGQVKVPGLSDLAAAL